MGGAVLLLQRLNILRAFPYRDAYRQKPITERCSQHLPKIPIPLNMKPHVTRNRLVHTHIRPFDFPATLSRASLPVKHQSLSRPRISGRLTHMAVTAVDWSALPVPVIPTGDVQRYACLKTHKQQIQCCKITRCLAALDYITIKLNWTYH